MLLKSESSELNTWEDSLGLWPQDKRKKERDGDKKQGVKQDGVKDEGEEGEDKQSTGQASADYRVKVIWAARLIIHDIAE